MRRGISRTKTTITTNSTSVWVTTTSGASAKRSGRASTSGRTTSELRVAPLNTTARRLGAPRPATLLAAWLGERLGVDVARVDGPMIGVNAVVLNTTAGDITVRRVAEGTAVYQVPGEPERTVALRRRPLPDLLTEELQSMEADDVFEAATLRVARDSEAR